MALPISWQVMVEDGRPVVSFGDWQAVQRVVTAAVSAAWRSYLPDRLLRRAPRGAPQLQPSRHSAPSRTATSPDPHPAPQHGRKRASAGVDSCQNKRPGAAWRQQAQRPAAGLRSLSDARLVSGTRNTAAVASVRPLHPWSADVISGGLAAHGSLAADTPMAAHAPPDGRSGAAAAVPLAARDSTPAQEPMLLWQPQGSQTPRCGPAAATDQHAQPQPLCSIPRPARRHEGSTSASRSKHDQQAGVGSEICRPSSAPPHPAKRLKAAHRNLHSSTASGILPVRMGLRKPDTAELQVHSKAGAAAGTPASSAVPQPQRVPLREIYPQHSNQPQQRSDPAAPGHVEKQRQAAGVAAARRAALTSVRRRRTSASQPLDWAQPPRQQQEQQRQSQQPVGIDSNEAAAGASSGAGSSRQPLSAMVAAWDNPALLPPAAPAVLSIGGMAKSDSRLVPKGIAREDLADVHIIGQASHDVDKHDYTW